MAAKQLELLILGSGTSSQVPSISCLTDPTGLDCCACCRSKDRKDTRRNTSAVLRVTGPEIQSAPQHILIDVGKSFCESAREFFPKNGIRELAAVLLTHPHADAINGLDDLRAWTLGEVIQASIRIYCNAYTLSEISRSHSYLVDTSAKTGGGDVPDFSWHVIEDGVPFEILGVQITPLPVHHGVFFGSEPRPYICLAYLFDRSICYMADVSHIPETTLQLIQQVMRPALSLPVLVLDTLRIEPHGSHFGIGQAVQTAQKLRAARTYLLGFSHRVTHACWVHCCEAISEGQSYHGLELPPPDPRVRLGIIEDFEWFTQRALREVQALQGNSHSRRIWIRPAFDGLWLKTSGELAWDDEYVFE